MLMAHEHQVEWFIAVTVNGPSNLDCENLMGLVTREHVLHAADRIWAFFVVVVVINVSLF